MSQPDPDFLVFVTRVKGESAYIQEWLDYHLHVGVHHFYLYDMDGGSDFLAALQPYEHLGVVTRIDWTGYEGGRLDRKKKGLLTRHNKTSLVFRHYAHHYRDQAVWALKIDADEFLYPESGGSVIDALQPYLVPGVKKLRLPRYNFGHNGHLQKPPGGVLENYRRRETTWSQRKELVRTRCLSPQFLERGAHCWETGFWMRGRTLPEELIRGIRINHYYSKSFEEFQTRQNTNRTRQKNREQFEDKNKNRNVIYDDGMLRLMGALRATGSLDSTPEKGE